MLSHPLDRLCIGCGRDHPPGRGCGYERDVEWLGYSRDERLKHVRFFPVVVGLVCATVAVYFIVVPPDNPIFLYVGVGLPSVVAVLFGGFGIRAMVEELRKERHRGRSMDGRDRALAVLVGGELHYAFGESLKYEPVVADLGYAGVLSSAAALALSSELVELADQTLTSWLRRDSKDDDLLRDFAAPEVRFAFFVTMAVVGLVARGEIALFVGRYKPWGRGGKKLPQTTTGFEVALDALESETAADYPFERRVVALSQPGDESPTPLDALVDAITEETKPGELEVSDESLDLEAARDAWRRVQEDETELIMRVLQHVLPERPRTIGVVQSSPAVIGA